MTGWMQRDAEEAEEALEVIRENETKAAQLDALPGKALEWMRKSGLQFKGEGGRWEGVAFILYSLMANPTLEISDLLPLLGEAPPKASEAEQSPSKIVLGEG